MMKLKIRSLSREDSDAVFGQVAQMFADMYHFMERKGLTLELTENGENIWIESIKMSLGKLNAVFLALDDEELVGFVAGNIKVGPAFLGSKKIGYLSHVYVIPEQRQSEVGNSLVKELEKWFFKNEVDFIEGEVLYNNKAALNFFTDLGFKYDNVRIHKNNGNKM